MGKPGTWEPGQSGNPKGRPPKDRALTAILERAGAKSVEVNGKSVTSRQLLARLVWQAVLSGRVDLLASDKAPVMLPDGEPITVGLDLDGKQWVELVKFLYGHIDGPPKQQVEVGGRDGGDIVVRTITAVIPAGVEEE